MIFTMSRAFQRDELHLRSSLCSLCSSMQLSPLQRLACNFPKTKYYVTINMCFLIFRRYEGSFHGLLPCVISHEVMTALSFTNITASVLQTELYEISCVTYLSLLQIGGLQAVCFFPCRLCGFYVPVNRVLLLQTDTLCNVLSLEGSAPYVLVPFSSKALDSRRRVLVCKLKTNSMRQVTQLIHTRFSQWRRPSW
jgi:hypothetical protein